MPQNITFRFLRPFIGKRKYQEIIKEGGNQYSLIFCSTAFAYLFDNSFIYDVLKPLENCCLYAVPGNYVL